MARRGCYEIPEMRLAVALVVYGALLVCCLLGLLFDNLVFEGICGRFGSYDGSDVCHIGSLGDFRVSDDVSVSFTVWRLLLFRQLKHVERIE